MAQTGLPLASADPGVETVWGGWDFVQSPSGCVVAACHPPQTYQTTGDVSGGTPSVVVGREGRLRVHRYDDSLAPEPTSYVEVEANYTPTCAMVCDTAGRLHLFYSYWDTTQPLAPFAGSTQLRYRRSDDDGATWGTHEAIDFAPIASLRSTRGTNTLMARITRDGLCVLLYQHGNWVTPSDIRAAMFVGSMGADGMFDFLAPQRSTLSNATASNDLQAAGTGGRLYLLPHLNELSNIQAAGGMTQTQRATSTPSPALIGLGSGFRDELTDSWLQMGNFRGDAGVGMSDRTLWVWSNLIPAPTGGTIGLWSEGLSPYTAGHYFEGYGHTLGGGGSRLSRRADGVLEFLYPRHSDGNLVFAYCRDLRDHTRGSICQWDIG